MNPFQNRTNEEKLNIYIHLLGMIAFLPIGSLLLTHSNYLSNYLKKEYVSMLHNSVVFCVLTTIFMFLFSTLRHIASPNSTFMKKLDNIGVFWGVIGFYMPLITLSYVLTDQNYWLIWTTFSIAVIGTLYKLFVSDKNSVFIVMIYLSFGWLAVSFIRDFVPILTNQSFWAIIASGATWTIGAIIYKLNSFKYAHATWHFLMVVGSLFMYISIFSILNDHHF